MDHEPDTQWWSRHVQHIHSIARALYDGEDAADLEQEAWVAILSRQPVVARVSAWVAGLLRNLKREQQRSDERRHRREIRSVLPAGSVDPAQAAVHFELLKRIVALVDQLDAPYRQVILLKFFEDKSAERIARELGVPAATVRSRIARAVARLRAQLDEHDGGRSSWVAILARHDPVPASAGVSEAGASSAATAIAGSSGITVALLAAGVLVMSGLLWWGGAFDPPRLAKGPERMQEVTGLPLRAPDYSTDLSTVAEPEVAAIKQEDSSTDRSATLVLRVLDRDGHPAAGAEVVFVDLTQVEELLGRDYFIPFEMPETAVRLSTDAGGHVALPFFTGSAVVCAEWSGQWGRQRIRQYSQETETLRLEPSRALEVFVRDALDQALPDCPVLLKLCKQSDDGTFKFTEVEWHGWTGSGGVARIPCIDWLATHDDSGSPMPFDQRLEVSAGVLNYESVALELPLPDRVTIELPLTSDLRIRFLDAAGKPYLRPLQVQVFHWNGGHSAGGLSVSDYHGAEGSLRLRGVGIDQPFGIFAFSPEVPQFQVEGFRSAATTGTEATVDLMLPPVPRVRAIVKDSMGALLCKHRVHHLFRIVGKGFNWHRPTAWTNGAGLLHVAITDPDADSMRLWTLDASSHLQSAAEIPLAGLEWREDPVTQEKVLDLGVVALLPVHALVSGRVVDETGRSLAGAEIRLLRPSLLSSDPERVTRTIEGRPWQSAGTVDISGPDGTFLGFDRYGSVAAEACVEHRVFAKHPILGESEPIPVRLPCPTPVRLEICSRGIVQGTCLAAPLGQDSLKLQVQRAHSAPRERGHSIDLDPEGQFHLAGLMEGSYELLVRHGNLSIPVVRVPFECNPSSKVLDLGEIRLDERARLCRIEVTDPDLHPIPCPHLFVRYGEELLKLRGGLDGVVWCAVEGADCADVVVPRYERHRLHTFDGGSVRLTPSRTLHVQLSSSTADADLIDCFVSVSLTDATHLNRFIEQHATGNFALLGGGRYSVKVLLRSESGHHVPVGSPREIEVDPDPIIPIETIGWTIPAEDLATARKLRDEQQRAVRASSR